MQNIDSDVTPLEHRPRLSVPKPWRRWVESAFILGSIFLGGVGTGVVFMFRVNDAEVARVRQDSLAEIARLQQAYGFKIESAATQASAAASAAVNAAEAAGDAALGANTAASAAKTAAEAVKKPKPAEGR